MIQLGLMILLIMQILQIGFFFLLSSNFSNLLWWVKMLWIILLRYLLIKYIWKSHILNLIFHLELYSFLYNSESYVVYFTNYDQVNYSTWIHIWGEVTWVTKEKEKERPQYLCQNNLCLQKSKIFKFSQNRRIRILKC